MGMACRPAAAPVPSRTEPPRITMSYGSEVPSPIGAVAPTAAHDAVAPIANSHPQRLRIGAILVWSLDLTEPFWHLRQRLDLSREPQGCRISVTRGAFRSFWSCSQR